MFHDRHVIMSFDSYLELDHEARKIGCYLSKNATLIVVRCYIIIVFKFLDNCHRRQVLSLKTNILVARKVIYLSFYSSVIL